MTLISGLRITLLWVAISLMLAGCSDDSNEMSQEEIQYLSHLDQSRFFQRQGELKASTLEARSAIEMQPDRTEPYLLILNNLLTAGDAVTAERQLRELMENAPDTAMTQPLQNEALLILAEANLMQGKHEAALSALDDLDSAERGQEQEATLIRGRVMLASGKPEQAQEAFTEAHDISPSAEAQVGLSRAAMQLDQPEASRKHLNQAAEIDPESSELWLWRAQIAEESRNWAEAEEAYINALEHIGRYDVMTFHKYSTISALIRVLREQGKSAEAFVYEEILAKSAPGTIKSNLEAAQSAYTDGNFDEAARYLEEIRTQSPGNEQAALMLGLVRFRQGRADEAEKLLAPIAELGDSELASKLVAASRLQLRDPQGAQQILENLESADSDPSILAMVGIASLSTGNITAAETLLEKSLRLAPENQDLRARYVRYLLTRNQTDRAFEQIRTLKEQTGSSPLVRTLSIQAHLAANNQQQAIEIADEWLEESPDDLAAIMTRGDIAARNGNYDIAARYFEKAAQTHNTAPLPLISLGRLALAQEQPEIARQRFREAARLSPDNMQALQGMASTYPTDELKSEMEQLTDEHPDAIAPRLILLEIALTNGNQERSDELTAALLEREGPDSPAPAEDAVANIFNGVGARMLSSGNVAEAAKVLERGRVLFPENENLALRAAALAFNQDEPDKARRILQEVKQVHSESPAPYLVEARYFSSQNQHQQAAELYELAISKGAGADAKLSLVRSMARADRNDEAIQIAENALEEHPDHQGLLVTTALLHQQTGNSTAAIQAYERARDAYPQNPLVLNNLAWLYFEEGDNRAGELARKAYELSPDNAAIADTYGWILLKSGRTEASLAILEKAHELAPESQEIALHLAEAYREIGRNGDAKRILEKFSTPEEG